MQLMRFVGAALAVAVGADFHPCNAQPPPAPSNILTAWSTNGASCVADKAPGVSVAAGAVTAGGGITITLYCSITHAPTGAFDSIEITYKGAANKFQRVATSAELIEMSKATGAETLKCGFQGRGSSTIITQGGLCSSSELNFNSNIYYVRIVLKSGIAVGQLQTVYGTSLTLGTACPAGDPNPACRTGSGVGAK
jgi:hypothetical protein